MAWARTARRGRSSGCSCSLFTARIFKQEFVRSSIYHGNAVFGLMHHNLLPLENFTESRLHFFAPAEWTVRLLLCPKYIMHWLFVVSYDTGWSNGILLRKLESFICCLRDLFLSSVWHLSNSIYATSISGVKSSWTILQFIDVPKRPGSVRI